MALRKVNETYGNIHERPSGNAGVVFYALGEPAHQTCSVVHVLGIR